MKNSDHQELLQRLSATLPAEALRNNPGFGISINDAYVKQRLNEVLGPGGWLWKPKPEITSEQIWAGVKGEPFCDKDGAPFWEVTASVSILIPAFKKTYFGEGGFRSTDRGNARKGAVTDAFGKAMSDLVGVEVYKGMLDAEFKLSERGGKSIYRVGVVEGWNAREAGLSQDEAIKQAMKDYDLRKE